MRKVAIGMLLVVVLVGGTIAAVAASNGAKAQPKAPAQAGSGSPAKVVQPVVPTISVPADAKDAQALVEINQMIAKVMQEAAQRPPDQQMTQEQIKQMVISKVEDIGARR